MTLTPDGYLHRYADDSIDRLLKICGAVHIKGPKGCGKTWTALNHANSALILDDPTNGYENRTFARNNPEKAVTGEEPRLIDEWQMAPAIWDSTRRLVDSERRKGRVILCGSSTLDYDTMSQMHSGFARICTYRMRTMSLYESGDSDGAVALSDLFAGSFVDSSADADIENIAELIVRGGWPETIGMNARDAYMFNRIHLGILEEDDLHRMDRNASSEKMRMLVASLARNVSTLATDKTVRSDMRTFPDDPPIAQDTFVKYMDYLDRLNLIENQPAFNPNLKDSVRVGKSPKRHLVDPSLAAVALKANSDRLVADHHTLGTLFESMCVRDLRTYAEALDGQLFHYRDGNGREIDAVVEMPDGRWGAFEIKLTDEGVDKAASNLLKINEYISGQEGAVSPSVLCVICGTAKHAKLRDDGVYVVPIANMRA